MLSKTNFSQAVILSLALVSATHAQAIVKPGQPRHGIPGYFELIGNSLVSAQQLFLGTANTVYFVDKVEKNPSTINNHPAWASEWTLSTNEQRALDARTNTFCAGGTVLGNGTWINVGGNQAVVEGGAAAPAQDGSVGPYFNGDGRQSIRLLNPCDDKKCDWTLSPLPLTRRWYPSVETLADGSAIILGGCQYGGYVNSAGQDNPTFEMFPPSADPTPVPLQILSTTLPANLYPLTWLLPSGKLLIQSNWATALVDLASGSPVETRLDNIPDAVRVYPASAGTVMLPLTPENNYTATILFCGGSNVQPNRWTSPAFIVPTYAASTSCVRLTPDQKSTYDRDEALPEARSMANFIILPDGRVLNINGAKYGTAGYGNNSWAIGHSYADDPVMVPRVYDPSKPVGSRWSDGGYKPSDIPRMYHSTALLLPDGSVMVSGSNPNPDFVDMASGMKYPTEYRTELFYPEYFNERRPEPQGLVSKLTYGGDGFEVTLTSEDLFGNIENLKTAKVVIIRTGFSTHSMNMGQRFVELRSTYTGYLSNNTATLHVSQLPPNANIIAPGPALLFVVVNGVPSVGVQVMLGSGRIERQPTSADSVLPQSQILRADGSVRSPQGQTDLPDTITSAATTKKVGSLSLIIMFAVFMFLCR